MLEDLHARLSGVVIECLDFGAFIQRYDAPETLFYRKRWFSPLRLRLLKPFGSPDRASFAA